MGLIKAARSHPLWGSETFLFVEVYWHLSRGWRSSHKANSFCQEPSDGEWSIEVYVTLYNTDDTLTEKIHEKE